MFAHTKDKKVIYIENALPKTDYYCIFCGGRLRVRKPKNKIKHFWHIVNDCGDRGESFLHKCWKKYFLKQKVYDGYNIIKAEEEVPLLNGDYRPDIVYTTDKGTSIIIEINFKNSKDKSYLEKFELLPKNFIKVFEIKVDFGKIVNTKTLFNREKEKELQIEIEKKRKYILNTYYKEGGLVYKTINNEKDNYIPPILQLYFNKDIPIKYKEYPIDSTWKRYRKCEQALSSRGKEFKVYLEEESENIKVRSESFSITIYDYINMEYYCSTMKTFSIKLFSQDVNLTGNINIVLDEK